MDIPKWNIGFFPLYTRENIIKFDKAKKSGKPETPK